MADRKRRYLLAAIALSFLFVPISGLARAATITANATSDPGAAGQCGLRDAIGAADGQAVVNGCVAGSGNNHGLDVIDLTGERFYFFLIPSESHTVWAGSRELATDAGLTAEVC